ncbi:polysaccharide biosynthesis protein [Sphingomonas sp. JC676]|uniref:nucleoside-diphosphate sugar epimerase/dehydratase n=1 Tax=Sphingomonas sp. JC676 TaxID=2768065 RepID=UPI0016578E74|nr:nucleoside-diphosphate sugar epimerase/dehydratase [Sphingomonas sp. JC676]MBC9031381.1 polysaccharide biosynthesis protein [Sphingomonas sp. JC676]
MSKYTKLTQALPSGHSTVIFLIDALVSSISLPIALILRVGSGRADEILNEVPFSAPLFLVVAMATFWTMRTYRRLWRFVSVGDLVEIAKGTTLAISVYLLLLLLTGHLAWMPRSIPAILWLVQIAMMGGARVIRRLVAEYLSGAVNPPQPILSPVGRSRRVLLVGSSDRVERLLRYIEREGDTGLHPIGILDTVGVRGTMQVRGVPILGSTCELSRVVERLEASDQRPQCLLFASHPDQLRGSATVGIAAEAQSLNLDVAYLPGLITYRPNSSEKLDLRFIDIAELLGRPQIGLDSKSLQAAIHGRRVLVTGAGGTIGRELVRQIAAFEPERLILLDACEFNLYEIDLEMCENHPRVSRTPVLCSIRQREQLMRVFAEHRPELVFHAAALKHVPLVEEHPTAGVQTNILGTRNVADAVMRYGALAMVQVSTDKAVNPVGFMGVTKRLGELYCQALDLAGVDTVDAPRFMTVRFGNVLGSSGSLIPLFQRQLSRGGPLTVTHKDIERFFMTVHEAVQLVLHSAARGLYNEDSRGRIHVLDMGAPVRIMDVARRMIRLAGLEPDLDVNIEIVGLRPGEKLFEELFDSKEKQFPSGMQGVFEAVSHVVPLPILQRAFDQLEAAANRGDDAACRTTARALLSREATPARRRSEPQIERPQLVAHLG